MREDVSFAIYEQQRELEKLKVQKLDENKTNGERAAIHRDIFAVEYSINILNKLER